MNATSTSPPVPARATRQATAEAARRLQRQTFARRLLPYTLGLPLLASMALVLLTGQTAHAHWLGTLACTSALSAVLSVLALRFLRHQHRADSARWQNLSRLAQVAEATASAVIVTDIHGVIQWINAGFTRISGYSLDECAGRRPGELLQGPATNREVAARVGAALRARQPVAVELVNYHKNGKPYWLGMRIEPLVNDAGEVDGFMAIEADITERREQRLQLETLTSRFNLATRAAHIGVFERSLPDEKLWWNDVMFELFGEDPASYVPSWETSCARIHPEDRDEVIATMAKRVDSLVSASVQYRIVRQDGSIVHVESIASGSRSADDDSKRVAGILLNVTQRVAIEEREEHLQRQLRQTAHQAGMAEIATGVLHNVGNVLNSLGVAYTTARTELQNLRLERLEQTAALMRDHRADLASFLMEDPRGKNLPNYISALSNHVVARSQSLLAEFDTMDHLLHHLREIVNSQQSLAQKGGFKEPVDLREIIEAALRILAADLAHVEVIRRFEDLPQIPTDRHKLMQIIVNFLGNARDAVRGSGAQPARIGVRLTKEGNDALITIEDSGVGMTAEVLSRLWRFGFTTKPNGHGFGLHNCANSARELGATLDATSAGPGRGSAFILRLPIDREAGQVNAGAAA